MTTDAPAQSLPASRLFKGTTAFLLGMAVALTSATAFAKTPAKPAVTKAAAKAPASGKKSVKSAPAKTKAAAGKTKTKTTVVKAKAKPASTVDHDNKAANRQSEAAAATATIGAPVKEEVVANPAIALAPPVEAAVDLPVAKPEAPVRTTSADIQKQREVPAQPLIAASTDKPAAVAHAKADATPTKGGIRELASGAAASTLTLLLPHIAAGDDALPLLGRSTEVASNLGRLLAGGQGKATGAQPVDDKVQSLLKRALTLLGTPYRWGGTSPESGFDCSGLVGYVFRTALGIELPRVSRDMARKDDAQLIKSRDELREGDLVFFGRGKGRIDHVGIYLGNGMFVHAPRTGKDVEVSSLSNGYWSDKFKQARRVEL